METKYGFIPDVVLPEDYVFGSILSLEKKFGGEPLQPDGDWRPFLPTEERQAPGYETQSCVAHATLNCLEILARRVHAQTRNFSDRFVAKGSGTDPLRGNSPKKVADFIYRNFACHEDEWPTKAANTVEEFYADIPDNLKTLAKGRGLEFDLGYEFVPTSKASLKEALKFSPLGISVPAWHQKNGKYYRPEGAQDNHFTALIAIDGNELVVFDTYYPFIKRMAADFLPTVAMAYHLDKRKKKPEPFAKFIAALRKILGYLKGI